MAQFRLIPEMDIIAPGERIVTVFDDGRLPQMPGTLSLVSSHHYDSKELPAFLPAATACAEKLGFRVGDLVEVEPDPYQMRYQTTFEGRSDIREDATQMRVLEIIPRVRMPYTQTVTEQVILSLRVGQA